MGEVITSVIWLKKIGQAKYIYQWRQLRFSSHAILFEH